MKRIKKDLTGQKFNMLTVLYEVDKSKKHRYWLCRCDCGTEKSIRQDHIERGITKSCGCIKQTKPTHNYRDLAGIKFNKLVVIKRHNSIGDGKAVWLCECECGNKTLVISSNLTCGTTTSCGCNQDIKRREYIDSRNSEMTGKKFGRLTTVRPNKKRVNGKIIWECLCECGVTTYVASAKLTNGHTRSCGCIARKHEETRNWYNILRTTKEYMQLRKDIIKRDGCCIKCGSTERLQVHHVISPLENEELFMNERNLVTLCRECHGKKDVGFHSLYGTKNFTENNFKEFMKGVTV